MALTKIDVLAIGRGSLTDNSNAAIVISANNLIALWSSSTTYAQYNVVEYSGKMYRSKVGSNLNNQPDISPNQFEVLYVAPKDGDLAVIINGGTSSIVQRSGNAWAALSGTPLSVSLVDGQVSPADAVVFVGAAKSFAKLEYTLSRGGGQGRKRKGLFNVLNDNATTVEYDHTFNEIGLDVNATFSWTISGGNVHLQYVSGLEGVSLAMQYTLGGWS